MVLISYTLATYQQELSAQIHVETRAYTDVFCGYGY